MVVAVVVIFRTIDRDSESAFLQWVLAFGILGASTQAASSLATYVGSRQFSPTWAPFYLIHPVVGGSTAAIAYVLVRGVLLSEPSPDDLNQFGFAALSYLIGFSSRAWSARVEDVFAVMFGSYRRQQHDYEHDLATKLGRFDGYIVVDLESIESESPQAMFDDAVVCALRVTTLEPEGNYLEFSAGAGQPAKSLPLEISVRVDGRRSDPAYQAISVGTDHPGPSEVLRFELTAQDDESSVVDEVLVEVVAGGQVVELRRVSLH